MSHFFSRLRSEGVVGNAELQTTFDAEYGTPELIDSVAIQVPQIRDVMASLRESLPLVPHSGVGPLGRSGFFRIPNHYRSVCFVLPPSCGDSGVSPGVIVFKGTEPLLADFPQYFDWMLSTPFRASPLPLALHFPLDMKLPPAAMWMEECAAEQNVSSKVQQAFLRRYGRLARLPLPLFVLKMTPAQNARYEETIRSRLSGDAIKKIKNKLVDGIGVEVYYYPELPVRVADLLLGNVRESFKAALAVEQVERTFGMWMKLLTEMLCLGYMPYAPWHHGMGACVDRGNVCIDGGFNDLLTLIPFDAIPSDALFQQSLMASVRMLSESMTVMAVASIGIPPAGESEAAALMVSYATKGLRENIRAIELNGQTVDVRLLKCFDPPELTDIFHVLRDSHRARTRPTQYAGRAEVSASLTERVGVRVAAGS